MHACYIQACLIQGVYSECAIAKRVDGVHSKHAYLTNDILVHPGCIYAIPDLRLGRILKILLVLKKTECLVEKLLLSAKLSLLM